MSKLLTIHEAADALRLHHQSVRSLIKTGELRASRVGAAGAYRIRQSDVDAYLDRTTVGV